MSRFRDSWRNLTRITTVRIIVQAVFFGLFLAFVLLTTFANLDRMPTLRHWVGKILEIDPLVSISTAITTHTVYKGLLWSLIILVPTLFLGRFFCNWICPYGTLHHFVGWAFSKRNAKESIDANRYRRAQAIKYYLLIALLVLAAFGVLQIGLIDPIALVYRSFTGAVLPAAGMTAPGIFGDYGLHQGAWLIGAILFTLVALNLVIPRFFCRFLCPLGGLLGLTSRFAWWRIDRDPAKCNNCDRCRLSCEAACDPQSNLRCSECFVCFNCIEDCPEGALSFRFMPPKEREVAGPDASRRKLIFAGVTGLVLYPFLRTDTKSTRDFSSRTIRPPGSVEELDFLERCIKCDQCVRVCPTNVIQPAWFEGGVEGLWTPVMNFRVGHCQLNCTACGYVCPTGAIQPVKVAQKLGLGEFSEQGPIRIGTAHVEPGRCLPLSKNVPCVVCEEVCPTSPKAIYGEHQRHIVRGGELRAVSATADSVTAFRSAEAPSAPPNLEPGAWKGDDTKRFYLRVQHPDGVVESHRLRDNGRDRLLIEGEFARPPEPDSIVVVELELKVPRVDTNYCIGCGLCERECPVVGDRRAIYVTAEGETRSRHCQDRDRNRSLRLRRI